MLRFCALALVCFFLSFPVYGQNNNMSRDAQILDSLEHQVGIGVHMMPYISPLTNGPLILQGSYMLSFESLKLRTGMLGGKNLLNSKTDNSLYWGVTGGIQKTFWNPGKIYSLNLGFDFLYIYEKKENLSVIPEREGRPTHKKIKTFGFGFVSSNNFKLDSRSSISLELGINGGISNICVFYKKKSKNCLRLTSYIFDPRFRIYRQAVLSYHYSF